MTKRSYLVWIVALVLGWGFDFMFWRKPLGINFSIYLTACLLAGVVLLLTDGLRPARMSLWLVLPFAFFGVITCVRQEPLTLFLGIAGSFISLGLLVVSYQSGQWIHYSLLDYLRNAFLLVGSLIVLPIRFLREQRVDPARIRRLPLKPVAVGVLIALPVLAFFTVLLAAGDIVFRQKIIDFFRLFDTSRIPEIILRLIIILFVAYLLIGIFLHAAHKSMDTKLLAEGEPMVKRFLGFTEAAIVMGSVSLLFLLFVIVQFRYFFGGQVNIGVQGYTYSEYARSGFSELITVALFSLLMILGLGSLTQRESNLHKWAFSALSAVIALLVIVILVSAYQRLLLAIDWHGFSRLRFYPRVFMIWLGILFVAVIVLEMLRGERHFALAALLASLGFAISVCALDVDAQIVRHNVYRTLEGAHFNVNYLTSLSSDAIPGLVEAFNDASLPRNIHEGVGAALVCYSHYREYEHYMSYGWRSFNFSRWAAVNALNRVAAHLQDYRVSRMGDHNQVETPNHDLLYQCDQKTYP